MTKQNLVEKAKKFAILAHKEQLRKDGKTPYIEHPKAVVNLLKRIGLTNENILASAWLHDVIEDCGISKETLKKEFNSEVSRIVSALTRDTTRKRYLERIKNSDYSVQIIKLADTINNCSNLNSKLPEITIKRKISECRNFYLGLAKRISPEFYSILLEQISRIIFFPKTLLSCL